MQLEQPSPEVIGVLVELEGPVTDRGFVEDVLTPYARAHLRDWVQARADRVEIAALLAAVRDGAERPDADLAATLDVLDDWLARGRRRPPLTALEGMLWQSGFAAGDFAGPVHEDAVVTLQHWADDRRLLCACSAGPVAAQKALLAYSDHGDISDLFSGFFDFALGARGQIARYTAIAREIGELPAQLLFISSDGQALDAAASAGWQTCWLARDAETESETQGQQTHTAVTSFAQIELL